MLTTQVETACSHSRLLFGGMLDIVICASTAMCAGGGASSGCSRAPASVNAEQSFWARPALQQQQQQRAQGRTLSRVL